MFLIGSIVVSVDVYASDVALRLFIADIVQLEFQMQYRADIVLLEFHTCDLS